ncbi:MAG: hypothetical protein GEV06_19125 [Luteitalea sp.]|nr:hypothetical protein [Luteitalea sp.]
MRKQQQIGEHWIVDQLHTLAGEKGARVSATEWSDARDLTRLLIARLNGKQLMETFTLGELEDLAAHDETQADVRRRLQTLIARALTS